MREKQHPKATKNTCVVTALSRTQDRDQLQEHNRWSPSQPQLPETYFILKGILVLTQQTQLLLLLQKILVCFCFVSLSTFVGHVHCAVTRVSEPGGDVIERFPLPQNICRQQPEPEWVCQVQKFVGAGAGYICGPNYSDIGAYTELETPGQRRPGDQSAWHMSPTLDEIKIKCKSFDSISHPLRGQSGDSRMCRLQRPQIFRFWWQPARYGRSTDKHKIKKMKRSNPSLNWLLWY